MRTALLLLASCLIGSSLGQYDPNCNGKQAIVHLFEWKWTDIALECERFLGPAGYCGFQVSPPNEHVILPEDSYPWWQRYQPVSYKLHSRSGTREEFADMVRRCNAVGVRTYADAVINHMAGLGRTGTSYEGSTFDSDALSFPGVPYSAEHFTPRDLCPSTDGMVNNYSNASNVRNCYLVGLTDLYGAMDYVRNSIAAYLNDLVDLGVAGIRIDAAKHMWPEDIMAMVSRVKDLPTSHGFPPNSKLFVYNEVIDRDDGAVRVDEYYDIGLVTEFRYCMKMAWGIQDYGQLGGLVDYGWGMAREDRAFVFVDNHDNQRGHGGSGDVITHKTPREYKQAVSYMLAHPYGYAQVMSSYYFENSDQGPPSTPPGSDNTDSVPINADGSCGGGWVCEHRWNPIKKMVGFRNAVAGTSMENYWNNGGAVAFSRGNKGFFAMVKDGNLDVTLSTGLAAGTYCNIIDDCKTSVNVGADGRANIKISNYDEPILAICVGCDGNTVPTVSPGSSAIPTTKPDGGVSSTEASCGDKQRTVIFINKDTLPGQDLFIRGGIDHAQRPGCVENAEASPCAIPIDMNSLGATAHYDKYNAWSVGDYYLDWYGAQSTQGSYLGTPASGTPLAWTSNLASSPGYQPLNKWGDHYWMLDVDMDCSSAEQEWFEVKAIVAQGTAITWEPDVTPARTCTGTVGGTAPYYTKNHMARCGYVNVFDWANGNCEINSF